MAPGTGDNSTWTPTEGRVAHAETINLVRDLSEDTVITEHSLFQLADYLNDCREARHTWLGNQLFQFLRTIFAGAGIGDAQIGATAAAMAEIARMIPCFNPGNPRGDKANPIFLDLEHDDTWFVGKNGFELIKGFAPREIHFNQLLRKKVSQWPKERNDGNFVFTLKWPTSDRNATKGLMIRESESQGCVMGIGWERFLSAQGHNPWRCIHLCVNIGPLKRGEKRAIRGRIYLFRGTKEDCLQRFERWLARDDGRSPKSSSSAE